MGWDAWEPLTTADGAEAVRRVGAGSLLDERRRHGVRGEPLLELLVTATFVEATPVFFYTSGHMETYEHDPPVRAARGDAAAWRALEALVAPALLVEARAHQDALASRERPT